MPAAELQQLLAQRVMPLKLKLAHHALDAFGGVLAGTCGRWPADHDAPTGALMIAAARQALATTTLASP